MSSGGNPWDIPEWHHVRRETALVRHLVGSGATALGRANYADQTGEYYTAFFGLSVGLERLAKLILVADFSIKNNGQMPDERFIRRHGHKLVDLMDRADTVAINHALNLTYLRPREAISARIVECLDAFADASRGRYANFAALGNPNLGQEEPISKWWSEVAELVLKRHYYGKSAQKRVEENARAVDTLLSPFAMVRHFDESGALLDNVLAASKRTGQTAIVQTYGRYYTLTVVRWLSDIFCEISRTATYEHNLDAYFGMWEYLQTYTVDDSFLKTRKNWPLT